MKITKATQVRKNMVIYIVHALSNGQKWLEEAKVIREPYKLVWEDGHTSLKIDIHYKDHDSALHLNDFNVGASYNNNYLFTTKRVAKTFLKKFIPSYERNWYDNLCDYEY